MVEEQLVGRGIKQKEVLDAMALVPRHLFVEEALRAQAYSDFPLPIGEAQTISQPYIVAYMTESLGLTGSEKVLEVGTGSGYQAAVLSLLAERVFSIERISALASRTRALFDTLNYSNVQMKVGDGTEGWRDEAPFDAIIVTAAAPEVPEAYIEQLKPGGRLIIPVGSDVMQDLFLITRKDGETKRENLGGCRFVKLVGRYGWEADS